MSAPRRSLLTLAAIGTVTAVVAGTVSLAGGGTSSAPAPRTPAVSAAGSHRHGGSALTESVSNGGGIALPASWPAAVPVPAGTIQAAATTPGVWLLVITEKGSISQVRANVIRLYTTHGFVNKPQATSLIVLQNRSYRVTVLLYAHDHSNSATDMRLEVDKRTVLATTA